MIKEKLKLAGKKVVDTITDERFVKGLYTGAAVLIMAEMTGRKITRKQFVKKATPIERECLEQLQGDINQYVLDILRR